MLNIIITFLILSSLCLSNFQDGMSAFNKRALGNKGAKVPSENINNAINLFEQALNEEDSEETVVMLLRSYYYKGKFVNGDENFKKNIFDKAKALSEKYITIYPESAAIRYWYLANLGSWAEVYGILTAAYEGVADIMKNQSEKIIEIDKEYWNGGGYFMLGATHYKSPYIPFVLPWPDNSEAIRILKLSMNTGKALPNQQFYLAQALQKEGEKKESIRVLTELSQMDPSSTEKVEDLEWILQAIDLLK